jgi:hypothetical protein
MSRMSKIGLITLPALALVAGVACAADEIVFTCSGGMSAPDSPDQRRFHNESIVIDLSRGRVTGTILGDAERVTGSGFGEVSIVRRTEKHLSFKGVAENGDIIVGIISAPGAFILGHHERGGTIITLLHNDELASTYRLTCTDGPGLSPPR